MFSNKLKSRKLWVTVWAMAMVTYIVIAGKTDFISLATVLSAAPLVYCGVNAYGKAHTNGDRNNEN